MQLPCAVFDAAILVDGQGPAWFEVEPLTVLNVSQNILRQIPDEIRKLEFLKVLNISSNELEALPNALSDLPALKILDVSCNRCEVYTVDT
jgi:Leucine-rich repeat (LRR) protein